MAKWTWTDDEVLAQVTAAQAAADQPEGPLAVAVRFDAGSGRIIVDLDNDTTFMFPADRAEGVAGADPALIAHVEITPNGDGLRWPELDADLGLQGLLMGCFGGDPWMRKLNAERRRTAGSRQSVAEAHALRVSGPKAGRPRKRQA